MSRQRVLFVSSNGAGMGHLTRLLAIARRLPGWCEPLFLTMSTGIDAVRREGFWVDYIPSRNTDGLDAEAWARSLRARVVSALTAFDARTVVFDGTSAYPGLVHALDEFPEVWSIWSRRGMWKPLPRRKEVDHLHQARA